MGAVNRREDEGTLLLAIQRELKALRDRVGNISAYIGEGGLTIGDDGALRMIDDAGVEILYIGPDELGRQVFRLSREGGDGVLRTFFTAAGQAWVQLSKTNRVVVADDADTDGLARPWLTVPMYPKFSMAASTVFTYMHLPVASVTSETVLWEGRIGLSLHPYIQINGVWGQATGTNTATYRLKVDGTEVGTWSTASALPGESIQGPFNISASLESEEPKIQLTVVASGTGNVACQVYGVVCRQTP